MLNWHGKHQLPLLGGLLLVGGLVIFDALHSPESVIIATVVLSPFLIARTGTVRQTATVAMAASAAALSSAFWTKAGADLNYVVRVSVVVAGSIVAVLAAQERIANRTAVQRFALLASVAETMHVRRSLPEMIDKLAALLVPEFADYCVLDLVVGSHVQRTRVCVSGPDAAVLEREVLLMPPPPPTSCPACGLSERA